MRTHDTPKRAIALALVTAYPFALFACGWNPSRPFEREAPLVNEAISALDAGDAQGAASSLESYLSTGPCSEGNIGTPEMTKKRPNGTFDLALTLFNLGESYGRKFGEEELDAGDDTVRTKRTAEIECARRVLSAIENANDVPLDLRARARYLEGNLNFLDAQYEAAVKSYNEALRLSPAEKSDAAVSKDSGGSPKTSDANLGEAAAWNRAIALRRIEDKKDAGPDSGPDSGQDASTPDSGQDASKDGSNPDSGDDKDSGKDSSSPNEPDSGPDSASPDSGNDSGADASKPPPPQNEPDAAPPPPKASQDEQILDNLENAPTVQQEAARKQAGRRRAVRGLADK